MGEIFRHLGGSVRFAHSPSALRCKKAQFNGDATAGFARLLLFKEGPNRENRFSEAKARMAEMRALLLRAEFWGDVGHSRKQGELLFEAAQKAGDAAKEYRKASAGKESAHCLAVSKSLFWQAIRALENERTPCGRQPPDNCELQARCFARLRLASDASAKAAEYLRLSALLLDDSPYALGCKVLERKRAIMDSFFGFKKSVSGGVANMRPMIEAAQKIGENEGEEAVQWMKVAIGLAANTNMWEPAPA